MKLSDTLLYSENTSNLYIIFNTNNSRTRLILSNSSKNIFKPSVSIHTSSHFLRILVIKEPSILDYRYHCVQYPQESVSSTTLDNSRNGRESQYKSLQHSRRTKYSFATLEVVNEAGQKLASFLGQNASNVPEHHRTRMQVQKVGMHIRSRGQIREYPLTDSRPEPKLAETTESDVSDYESDTTDQPISESWKVTWPLCFENMHISERQPDLHVSICRGSSKAGPDRGVDLLLTCPGKPPEGVISI